MSINAYSIVRIIIGPCGACKFLRKKCQDDCIFAPYFDSDQGTADFESVHKIFGASNISKLLTNIPIQQRTDAVFTLCLEARARLRDPIYGCISDINTLQDQVITLQAELSSLQAHVATPPPQPPPQQIPLSVSDFPFAGGATSDMSSLAGAPVAGGGGEELLLKNQGSDVPSMPPGPN
ncbi:LOB domain-containing protein 30-like [Impatiens glandulifera]|uniref:LOB domain-containing protein 30-like n=1 Tax=Impatiens glandulifera TaxID=253017 RepID=UPI001FB091C8|nr:LOB domain-containing protein 30-like [Impatiens glandulifera]